MAKKKEPVLQVAWRVVRPDFTSKNDYRWPYPGNWAYPNPTDGEMTNGDACPQFDGDGLCLAKTWAGAASGGIPATVALLCHYDPADVLGEDGDKIRVRKALVVDVYDPQRLIRDGWCTGANLTGADLTGADLTGADLTGADLYGANLTRANLTGADLYGADLYGADLYGANLTGADLYGANLTGANLYRANLYGANLTRADLTGADLYRADLYGANLTGANLTGANLTGANLTRANLTGANLTRARADEWTRLPDGWVRTDAGLIVPVVQA